MVSSKLEVDNAVMTLKPFPGTVRVLDGNGLLLASRSRTVDLVVTKFLKILQL